MSYCFYAPDKSDKRIEYATKALQNMGYIESAEADFVLYGINPRVERDYPIPCFAGNVSGKNIFDYTKDEAFAIQNAYLTAEGALALAVTSSERSLIGSNVLITGYGRIGKALHKYLAPMTKNITVCARSVEAQTLAGINGADTIDFNNLIHCNQYDYIFNTVPHPVFNEKELKSVSKGCLLMELASFPGGIDRHFAKYMGLNLIIAGGLPGKYSPKAAGEIVAKTVDKMFKEVII